MSLVVNLERLEHKELTARAANVYAAPLSIPNVKDGLWFIWADRPIRFAFQSLAVEPSWALLDSQKPDVPFRIGSQLYAAAETGLATNIFCAPACLVT